jgi:nucleotide-binding universal stress UspA family protein
MSHPTRKLSNSLEGALAGGGDPATSPLYVFGPFLRLVVVAGVASVTFGATVWLVVFTILVVSAMYRLVMRWVTDGSGGSGLCEEEFGPWAVKLNAGITFVEYTLTFLVSMAAMVTFIADRFPALNEAFLGVQYRTVLAISLSLAIGWLVNRGPKVAARAFGPATGGVLLLLWLMVFATVARVGLHLPSFDTEAFRSPFIGYTFGGYARILAVMTGIEVFANLVAAYEGPPERRSRLAFGSLVIVMGTAAVTMLIVGPAVLATSNPLDPEVSVFTQTMDALLPPALAYLGTLIGVLVLMSASAASAQGLQNLALGLTDRNYIPPVIGQRNQFGVADKPVWLEVGVIVLAFLLLGTHEETYLAIYAAGVFILLSLTGWAAANRLLRHVRERVTVHDAAMLVGTAIAALLTSAATILIFGERFLEGAWTYFVFIPILYLIFTYFRNMLGPPTPVLDTIGEIEGAMLGGFGYGQAIKGTPTTPPRAGRVVPSPAVPSMPSVSTAWAERLERFDHLLVPLDGSSYAEMALPMAETIARTFNSVITLVTKGGRGEAYLAETGGHLRDRGFRAEWVIGNGSVVDLATHIVETRDVNLVVASTKGGSGARHWLTGGVASRIARTITHPVLLVQAEDGRHGKPEPRRLLVALDGSERSESLLGYAVSLARGFAGEILLLSVPEVPAPGEFGADVVSLEDVRREAEHAALEYLGRVQHALQHEFPSTQAVVTGSRAASTIVEMGRETGADMIMIASRIHRGLGGLWMGNVAMRVVDNSDLPVFLLPIHEAPATEGAKGHGQRSGRR